MATFDAADKVKTIRLKGDKNELVLNKTTAGTWQYEKPAGFGEADLEGEPTGAGGDTTPSGVRPLLSAVTNLRASSPEDFIENVTDFKQYGLEPGKEVVLGLVSSKRPELESEEDLARRIEEAARYVPLDDLALSPQCGFASTMEGNLLTEDEQWAKLRRVVETARRVWRS